MVGRRLSTHRRAIHFIREELNDYEKDYSWQLDQSSTLYFMWRRWWVRVMTDENLDRLSNSNYISKQTFDKLVDFAKSKKDVNAYKITLWEKFDFCFGDVTTTFDFKDHTCDCCTHVNLESHL